MIQKYIRQYHLTHIFFVCFKSCLPDITIMVVWNELRTFSKTRMKQYTDNISFFVLFINSNYLNPVKATTTKTMLLVYTPQLRLWLKVQEEKAPNLLQKGFLADGRGHGRGHQCVTKLSCLVKDIKALEVVSLFSLLSQYLRSLTLFQVCPSGAMFWRLCPCKSRPVLASAPGLSHIGHHWVLLQTWRSRC